jgi:hypothetical protein
VTEWGKKLLAGTRWDEGMRGFFTRISFVGGQEDMEYAIRGIEEEATAAERARILAAAERLLPDGNVRRAQHSPVSYQAGWDAALAAVAFGIVKGEK